VPNSDLCHQIVAAADIAVVHEPYDDLPAWKTHYWRMGVPEAPTSPIYPSPTFWARPILGSIGFPFPWKHYDELCRLTAMIGWGIVLIAPNATPAQVETWQDLNPDLIVRTDFVPRAEAIAILAGCDATAFAYVCHNTGQSAAILQGLAARKPVLALSTCRQFRALYDDPLGREAIRWCDTFEHLAFTLRTIPLARCDPGIVALAEQDSWATLGRRYAQLYRGMIT
jgi:hypothetical protein